MHDPDLPEVVPSPFERELTPITSMISTNLSVPKRIITPELEMPPSSEIPISAEPLDDRAKTPSVNLEESPPAEMRLSPEVPALLNSPEEDLFFLDAKNAPSPLGYEPRIFDSMSARTRLVAQYFKDQSPMTQLTNDQSGNLSLNKILEGRTRKQCARMFFETLEQKDIEVKAETVKGLIEHGYRVKERYYNGPTHNMSRESVVELILNLAVEATSNSSAPAFEKGFEDPQSDRAARTFFNYGCSRGVTGTPFFYVNGFPLPGAGSALDYDQWRRIVEPLLSEHSEVDEEVIQPFI